MDCLKRVHEARWLISKTKIHWYVKISFQSRVAIKEASFPLVKALFLLFFPSETNNINQEYAHVCLQKRYQAMIAIIVSLY